jgi:hypothetical protein
LTSASNCVILFADRLLAYSQLSSWSVHDELVSLTALIATGKAKRYQVVVGLVALKFQRKTKTIAALVALAVH